MENPVEKKRSNYLSHFQDGVTDAYHKKNMNDKQKSSAYYRRGYKFGLTIFNEEDE